MRYRLIGSGGPKPVAIRIFAVVTFAFALLMHTAARLCQTNANQVEFVILGIS